LEFHDDIWVSKVELWP